jgi:hypothetical protein
MPSNVRRARNSSQGLNDGVHLSFTMELRLTLPSKEGEGRIVKRLSGNIDFPIQVRSTRGESAISEFCAWRKITEASIGLSAPRFDSIGRGL